MERFKLIPSVYLILEQDGKILLSRRFNTGYMDGYYSLVAGYAEAGEPMTVAMIREAKEEAGITIQPEDLHEVVTMHRNCTDTTPSHERMDFFFTADRWKGKITNSEPNKCSDLSWFPISDIPGNTIAYIREAIGCCETGKTYVEFGFEK